MYNIVRCHQSCHFIITLILFFYRKSVLIVLYYYFYSCKYINYIVLREQYLQSTSLPSFNFTHRTLTSPFPSCKQQAPAIKYTVIRLNIKGFPQQYCTRCVNVLLKRFSVHIYTSIYTFNFSVGFFIFSVEFQNF